MCERERERECVCVYAHTHIKEKEAGMARECLASPVTFDVYCIIFTTDDTTSFQVVLRTNQVFRNCIAPDGSV